jgi:hypothetical protein
MFVREKTFNFVKSEEEIARIPLFLLKNIENLFLIKKIDLSLYYKIVDVGDKITALVLKENSEGLQDYVNRNLEHVQFLRSEVVRAFYLALREG